MARQTPAGGSCDKPDGTRGWVSARRRTQVVLLWLLLSTSTMGAPHLPPPAPRQSGEGGAAWHVLPPQLRAQIRRVQGNQGGNWPLLVTDICGIEPILVNAAHAAEVENTVSARDPGPHIRAIAP